MRASCGDDDDDEIVSAPPLAVEIEDDDWVIRDDAPFDIAEGLFETKPLDIENDWLEAEPLELVNGSPGPVPVATDWPFQDAPAEKVEWPSDDVPLYRAHPYATAQYPGPWRVHRFDVEQEKTRCGLTPSRCPGDKIFGPEKQVTCKKCLQLIEDACLDGPEREGRRHARLQREQEEAERRRLSLKTDAEIDIDVDALDAAICERFGDDAVLGDQFDGSFTRYGAYGAHASSACRLVATASNKLLAPDEPRWFVVFAVDDVADPDDGGNHRTLGFMSDPVDERRARAAIDAAKLWLTQNRLEACVFSVRDSAFLAVMIVWKV